MNVYKVTFTLADGSTVNAELVTDMTLQTDYWTLTPSANGTEYSGYPGGVLPPPPPPVWTHIPNFLNQTSALSVDISTYVTPSNSTLTLGGSLPAGWSFASPNLSYDGTTLGVPQVINFNATTQGQSTLSNSFSVSGKGLPSADTIAPTIPLGISASAISQTTATLSGFPSSDPSPSALTWSGLAQYNVLISGAPGTPTRWPQRRVISQSLPSGTLALRPPRSRRRVLI